MRKSSCNEPDLIALPELDVAFLGQINIAPGIEPSNLYDYIIQPIDPATLPINIPSGETREYRIRVLNPDSGLYVDSFPDQTLQIGG